MTVVVRIGRIAICRISVIGLAVVVRRAVGVRIAVVIRMASIPRSHSKAGATDAQVDA